MGKILSDEEGNTQGANLAAEVADTLAQSRFPSMYGAKVPGISAPVGGTLPELACIDQKERTQWQSLQQQKTAKSVCLGQ